MKKLILTGTVGHPLSMDDFRHLQDGIKEALGAVAQSLGSGNFTLSGANVTVVGGNVSVTPGYIYFNGEVYPVLAQTIPTQVNTLFFKIKRLTVVPSPVMYKTGNLVDVHVIDVMELSYGSGDIDVTAIGKQSPNPIGVVTMYDGVITDFEENGLGKPEKGLKGWALCNGNNGTPDLRDRFIVGAGEQYLIGARGGNGNITLNANQLPAHTHGATGLTIPSSGSHSHDSVQYRTHDGSGSGANSVQRTGSSGNPQDATFDTWGVPSAGSAHTHSIEGNVAANTPNGSSIDIRPPYHALFYIKRIA